MKWEHWPDWPLDGPASGDEGAGRAPPPGVTLQPIHALVDASLLGAEARCGHGWTEAARARLTALLLHIACDEAVQWRDMRGHARLTVSARLPRLARGAPLVDQVAGALARTGLRAGELELGLCHDTAGSAGPDERLAWSALRGLGVGLAVEFPPDMVAHAALDEGRQTGLCRLPFTTLRLPPCVAEGVEHCPATRRCVQGAVRAARRQAGGVVAAGVRTAAQRDILADLGCHAAQGPLFGPPMHPAAFQAALAGDTRA